MAVVVAVASRRRVEVPSDIPTRIRALEGEICRLRLLALDHLVRTTVATIAGRGAFSAIEVWRHARLVSPELRHALDQSGITSARRLGKLFQRLQNRDLGGLRLERIGDDHEGVVWIFRECAAHSGDALSQA